MTNQPVTTPATQTPWGQANTSDSIADGITFYGTPSHGGYNLSPERLAQMPAKYRVETTGPGWFEEDCEALAVVLAFPECFPNIPVPQEQLRGMFEAYFG